MPLRIAVVGAGPAGIYAIQHLLDQTAFDVTIDLFERLPTPWGLVRAGVAPDHPEKKEVGDRLFQFFLKRENVRFFGNVEIGTDLGHDDLAVHYAAVIYAVGANGDNPLGIDGETLPGSVSAREFVAWYNGHPDYRDHRFDLSCERAVIIGTGNVALDVARILALPVDELARTDIADHALAALRASRIKEVVIIGRRGAETAAFNNPELEELLHVPGLAIHVEGLDAVKADHPGLGWAVRRKLVTLARMNARSFADPARRILFRFDTVPIRISGEDCVGGVAFAMPDGAAGKVPCGLVVRAIGCRGTPFPGLPFDDRRNVIANDVGRVAGVAGTYVTGWIKRGPRGVIGSNKRCADETVGSLLADAAAGLLPNPAGGVIETLLAARGITTVSHAGWQRIDRAERSAGRPQGRPRVKLTEIDAMLACADYPA